MHNPNLSFAKIVATPNDIAWSQVYNAGSLFLVIALTTDTPSDEHPLNTLGKRIINNLEAEFFTLETKDLPSIKSAITTSLQDIPETVHVSLTLAYLKETILYLLIVGPGKIIMKRGETIGVLLESKSDQQESITASGYVANEDTVLLQTTNFANLVNETTLKQAFELSLPSDIAETLAPAVHASEDGAASAIVIHIKGVTNTPQVRPTEIENNETNQTNTTEPGIEEDTRMIESHTKRQKKNILTQLKNLRFKKPQIHFSRNIRTIMFICIAVIIAIILIASIFKTVKKQEQTKTETAFHQIYDAAKKDYDDGTDLLSLNPGFAHDDFLSAKKKIEDGLPKFAKGSSEEKQLTTLLDQVNNQLGTGGTTNIMTPSNADKNDAPTLTALLDEKNLFASIDEDTLYTLSATDVLKDGKSVLKNNNDWSTPVGFSVYHGNIYILDKKAGVLKFVAGSDGYGKTDYFTDSKPDLSQATGMTIDGSIWITNADGRVMKFTKGQNDGFSIKGMSQLFSRPMSITTTTESTNLYILDPGTNRIAVVAKDGTYKKSYAATSLSQAKALESNEKNGFIYFLSQKKLYKLPL